MEKTFINRRLLLSLSVFQVLLGILMLVLGVYVSLQTSHVSELEKDVAGGLCSVHQSVSSAKDAYSQTTELLFQQIEVLKCFGDKTHSCSVTLNKCGDYMQNSSLVFFTDSVKSCGKAVEEVGKSVEITSKSLHEEAEILRKFRQKGHPEILKSFDHVGNSLNTMKVALSNEQLISKSCVLIAVLFCTLALVFLFNGVFIFPLIAEQLKPEE